MHYYSNDDDDNWLVTPVFPSNKEQNACGKSNDYVCGHDQA